jgi:class 3 adenylate cyclase/tetratricopeptide (TPR) repeat protein
MGEVTQGGTAASSGERKQITAVFIDVVGFSDIASTADAEDLQQWLEDFYTQSRIIIEAHDGEVTEYLGDGIVALFGLTRADELAASKAVNAAMTVQRAHYAGLGGHNTIKLRIGVATGEVAVRTNIGSDNLPRATGMVTTLAQRIQEKATPGTVMISETTQSLLRGSIATQAFPDQTLKGFAESQMLYRPYAKDSNTAASEHTFFVGRKAEIKRITQSNEPSVVIGPAGIGKSALARYFAQSAQLVTTFAADGVYTRASYQPFTQWILRETGMTLPEFFDVQAKFPSLKEDAQRALALVLGLPEGQRLLTEKSNVALKALIEDSLWQAIQSTQPGGLLIFEDLHWLDNASFGVLVHILQNTVDGPYQLLMTSREDTKIGKYLGRLPVGVIPLGALTDEESAKMLDALSDGSNQTDHKAALLSRAAGIPLFIEQLFKRAASNEPADLSVPGSLMDLLADQIDATGPAKPILQCAAIIGRKFNLSTLSAIAAEHAPLDVHLQRARQQGVLQQVDPQNWIFVHALLHQAAYQGMLRKTRVAYHGQIAAYLQEHHADAVQRNPALLTEHLSLAQQHVPAIQNLLGVSQWALFQGAFEDAEAHILVAVSLCAQAPDDVDVRALEIACHTALGSIRMQTEGFTADRVKQAFETVATLASAQNAYSTANGPAFYGTFTHAIISADKGQSDQFSDMLREAANAFPDDETNNELRLASLNVDTSLHFYTGDFNQASANFAKVRGIYDIAQHGTMIASYGVDTFAASQMFEAAGRAICGDAHLISELSAETDAHQDMLNIPVMLPYAQIWGAVPLFYAGETETAINRVLLGLQTAEAQGAAFWQVTGGAWINVMNPTLSDTTEGLAGFDQVIKTHEMIGANIGLPYFRAHYALALARHDRIDAAYQASLQATRENEASGLLCWYAEVLRVHASICQLSGRTQDAARFLEEAAELAIKQGANLWLLRTRLDQMRAGLIKNKTLQATLDLFDPAAKPPEVAEAKAVLVAA